MIPDFEIVTHRFPEREDITIIPISDVHLGARECMEQEFVAFINSIEKQPNTYVLLLGDLLNNCTRTSVSDIFEETMRPSEAKNMMTEILKPIKDKVIAAVGGNHERRNKDTDDFPVYDIMCRLGIENRYRENIAFVKLQFGEHDHTAGVRRPTYVLAITHGNGGGALTSGAVLRGERTGYALEGVDMLLFGHTHKPWTSVPARIVVDAQNNRVSVKPFRVLNVTSWLEYSTYAMRKMLLPTSHNVQKITLKGNHKEIIVTM